MISESDKFKPLANGTLMIASINPLSDSGEYTCSVRGSSLSVAKRALYVDVISKNNLQFTHSFDDRNINRLNLNPFVPNWRNARYALSFNRPERAALRCHLPVKCLTNSVCGCLATFSCTVKLPPAEIHVTS